MNIINKECKVVMLPTEMLSTEDNKASGISVCIKRMSDVNVGDLQYFHSHLTRDNDYWISQYLYITSDDEIKEGDWVFVKGIYTLSSLHVYMNGDVNRLVKVIATSDTNLNKAHDLVVFNPYKEHPGLPQIPQSFIESYVNNPVNSILVEYNSVWDGSTAHILDHEVNFIEELNIVNGEICVSFAKDSWSREEVIKLLANYREHSWKTGLTLKGLDNWIKERL